MQTKIEINICLHCKKVLIKHPRIFCSTCIDSIKLKWGKLPNCGNCKIGEMNEEYPDGFCKFCQAFR